MYMLNGQCKLFAGGKNAWIFMFSSQSFRGANKVEMVRTREDMLLVEEWEEGEEGGEKKEEEEEEEERWCPFARLEEHNLEWVIQVNYWRNDMMQG